MKTRTARWSSLVLMTSLLILILACNKKPESIGLDLVDNNKAETGFDTTFMVQAWSQIDDSVESDETSISLLGSMNTPTFGRVDAGFYSHLRMSSVAPDFGNNAQAVSMELILVYSGYYGNINTEQTVNVYRVTDTIKYADTYYTFSTFPINPNPIGTLTFTPQPNDSILIDSVLVANELHIPLDLQLANNLLDSLPDFGTSTDFIEQFFKGIYVEAEPVTATGDGAVLYFSLLNDRSLVRITYMNDTSQSELTYDLLINENSARVGHFEHDYEASLDNTFLDEVITEDTNFSQYGKEKLFLQAMGGIKTKIKFPNITSWADTADVVINEAKLVISALENNEDYPLPDRLLLFRLSEENGEIRFTEDQSRFGDDYYGGSLNESNLTYSFRITMYIQSLMLGAPDYGLELYPNAKAVRASGLSLYGTDHSNPKHLKLKLIYTRP
ncbi:MAG: DUF4270 domain-containing protein [Bacteroidales bacterium]|nr:DUF4270 domain-containing protein [Bacteroidales bacterium]